MNTITFKSNNTVSFDGKEYTGSEDFSPLIGALTQKYPNTYEWTHLVEYLRLHLSTPRVVVKGQVQSTQIIGWHEVEEERYNDAGGTEKTGNIVKCPIKRVQVLYKVPTVSYGVMGASDTVEYVDTIKEYEYREYSLGEKVTSEGLILVDSDPWFLCLEVEKDVSYLQGLSLLDKIENLTIRIIREHE